MPLLEVEDVGPHIEHHASRVLGKEQVVLAEHALAQEAEEHTQLGPHHGAPALADQSGRRLGQALRERCEDAPEARQVGVDPPRPVDHLAGGRPGEGVEAGVIGHQAFGLGGGDGEVAFQAAGQVAPLERVAPRHPYGDAAGEVPVGRLVGVLVRRRSVRLLGGRGHAARRPNPIQRTRKPTASARRNSPARMIMGLAIHM